MMKLKEHKRTILREYVRSYLLKEDDGGFGFGMMGDMIGPYGVHYASGGQLYNTFIKPFVDVVAVTTGKAKEMGARTLTAAKVAFEAIATTVIPWLTSDYEEIFQKEKQAIDKIRDEYKEVYAATWDAFRNKDVALIAFFCYPGIVMTSTFARNSPLTALRVMNVMSGGTMDDTIMKVKTTFASPFYHGHHGSHSKTTTNYMTFNSPGGDKMGWMGESIVKEDDGDEEKKKTTKGEKSKKERFADVVTDKRLVKKALSSPFAQRVQADARRIVENTLRDVTEKASNVMAATSLEDLQKRVGKPLKGMDKLHNVDKESRQEAEKRVLENVKKSMREFYVKNLEAQVKDAVSAGIPQDSGFVKTYAATINKIRSM